MPLEYKVNTAGRLNYLFSVSPVSIGGNFKIIRRRQYKTAFGRLMVYIIGESHAVQFKNKVIDLTEVLAYIGRGNLRHILRKKVLTVVMKNRLSYKYENKYFRYEARIKKDRITLRRINKLLSDFRNYRGKKLFLGWPDNKSLPRPSAFTFLSCMIKKNSIRIITRHFYNNEFILVTSASRITVKQQNSACER